MTHVADVHLQPTRCSVFVVSVVSGGVGRELILLLHWSQRADVVCLINFFVVYARASLDAAAA